MKNILIAVVMVFGLMGVAQAEGIYQCNSIVVFKDANGQQSGEEKRMPSTVIDKPSSFIMKNSGGFLLSGNLQDTGVKDKVGNPIYGSSQVVGASQVVMLRTTYRDVLVWIVDVKQGANHTVITTYEIDCVKQ